MLVSVSNLLLFSLPYSAQKFFKGCLSEMKLYSGNIVVQPSPGYIFGCQLKVPIAISEVVCVCVGRGGGGGSYE